MNVVVRRDFGNIASSVKLDSRNAKRSVRQHYTEHLASEGEFYIGGFVSYQFIEPVTFARCAFIFALRNIALGGYFRYT